MWTFSVGQSPLSWNDISNQRARPSLTGLARAGGKIAVWVRVSDPCSCRMLYYWLFCMRSSRGSTKEVSFAFHCVHSSPRTVVTYIVPRTSFQSRDFHHTKGLSRTSSCRIRTRECSPVPPTTSIIYQGGLHPSYACICINKPP